MEGPLFGPDWYAFLPYRYCQPSRRVVSRKNVPEESVFFDETLECGHVVSRMTGDYLRRSCPECPSSLPYLDGKVTIIEDEVVPYVPGDPRKKGWCFVSDPVLKVPCVHKTGFLLVNPTFAPQARQAQQEDVDSQRESGRKYLRKQRAKTEGGA